MGSGGRCSTAQQTPRRRLWLGNDEAAAAGLIWFNDRRPEPRRLARRHIGELAGNPVQGRPRFKIADHHQHGSVGPVVSLVKCPQVVGTDPGDVLGPTQDRIAVRMTKIRHREMSLVEASLRRSELAAGSSTMTRRSASTSPESNRPPRIRSASIASASSRRSRGNANQ